MHADHHPRTVSAGGVLRIPSPNYGDGRLLFCWRHLISRFGRNWVWSLSCQFDFLLPFGHDFEWVTELQRSLAARFWSGSLVAGRQWTALVSETELPR
uniref:Uncharacterized protein n=1 Tax=Hyaloperonospora arabidopsidis (strain Emoy2) TaxID=559515 RepID=M4BQC7_HYAAE